MLRLISSLAILALLISPLNAETLVFPGPVYGTWTQAGSPYLVYGNIYVQQQGAPSNTLTIEPGVTVIFQGFFELAVTGILNAEGTQDDSITFIPADTSVGWRGLGFGNNPIHSRLSYCNILYGKTEGNSEDGGGLYIQNTSPIFSHCTIARCQASGSSSYGGGAFISYSDAVFSYCDFIGNSSSIRGGGMYCTAGNPIFEHCTFVQNYAVDDGGGAYLSSGNPDFFYCTFTQDSAGDCGGGLACNNAGLEANNCSFIENSSADDGGGIYLYQASGLIQNCTIDRNYTNNAGGGIYGYQSSTQVVDCIITHNESLNAGGGVSSTTNLSFTNCTICDNIAGTGGSGFSGTGTLLNCIVWGNANAQLYGINALATYSTIQGGWNGVGNFTDDPQFVNPQGGDYSLQGGSFCIDTGNPSIMYYDPDGTIADRGAVYFHHEFLVTPRLIDYDMVMVGESQSQQLKIKNLSDRSLVISSLTFTDPCFTSNYNPADSLLAPYDSLMVAVTFAPQNPLAYEDTLLVHLAGWDWVVKLFGMGLENGTMIGYGNVSGLWTRENSPYWITGLITVPAGQTLIIEPGVIVGFLDPYQFIINGALRAIGTEEDSIAFFAPDTATGWGGIRLVNAHGSSQLSYGSIRYAKSSGSGGGIYIGDCSPTISHCTISHNQAFWGGGINVQYNSQPVITHCQITGNYAGQGTSGGHGGGVSVMNDANPLFDHCTIENNYSNLRGGGIYVWQSDATFTQCIMRRNESANAGGGIGVGECDPVFINCLIEGNTAHTMGGGGVSGFMSSPRLINCTITGNQALDNHGGGGIGGGSQMDDPYLENCLISHNYTTGAGGGIAITGHGITMVRCQVLDNTALLQGGGVHAFGPQNVLMQNCTIAANTASTGAGIYILGGDYSHAAILNCTITSNTAASEMGGFSFSDEIIPVIHNSIFWNNSPVELPQGGAYHPLISYCDVMGGYPGTGNINADPLFVLPAQREYRLQWGSPCIDTGDPNPQYNDPDGSRSDIGAGYYDQSIALRLLLTPYDAPIIIPETGGSFRYALTATNISSDSLSFTLWCSVTLPNGIEFGPVFGPAFFILGSGQTISRTRTQMVPARAPNGMYSYNALAVTDDDSSRDRFRFVKLGSGIGDYLAHWTNSGEEFETVPMCSAEMPMQFRLDQNYPNPFNPMTSISYQLPELSYISLKVYDTAGRLVSNLVNDWLEAGSHKVNFDGSRLSSGLYFVSLKAGDYRAVKKMMLIK